MVSQSDAEALLAAVRNLFKGGFKSCNKAYLRDETGTGFPIGAAIKGIERYANAVEAGGVITDWREQKKQQKLSDFEYGKFIWEHGTLAGNCHECACLAGYGASRPGYNFPNVYTVYIRDPGDHVFCLADCPNPPWSKILDLLKADEAGWIIDPWANVCCRPEAYPTRFTQKLKKWSGRGKRIFYDTKKLQFKGWTDALGEKYSYGFLNGPLTFNRCEKSADLLVDMGMMI